ncbi:DUF397 domain-containing protein [Nocardia pseudobrasiliensis]|uniref:Uncharacterized protein DUF397 n=1 Tax=Nocardia pseudobrasiliensis TaxID=45979 RepID=A0A370IBK7_9NOCA|nr:DUF397 domain-containing protein [Nocardia pseudobrasiliensis]RDI68097.1 uncharacterized protein DUF397 [Nocardia pseudobrasiliensis]
MSIDLSTAVWFKSSRSYASGDCLEVAYLAQGMVGIRDSKQPTGPALLFTPTEWSAFTADLMTGRFGHP